MGHEGSRRCHRGQQNDDDAPKNKNSLRAALRAGQRSSSSLGQGQGSGLWRRGGRALERARTEGGESGEVSQKNQDSSRDDDGE